ncbi:MAG: aldose 1-epimerase [Actinomycetaceae bacterium]|nr:aldose 1-epimerase [Actinomycetaceae bacterium]
MRAHATKVEPYDFFGMPTWRITTPSGASAVVAERGATLLSWQPRPQREVIDGYADGDELAGHVGNRSLVMAPWAGRIAGGAYSFDGQRYELPGTDETANFGGRVADVDFHRVGAKHPLVLRGELPGDQGYPWDSQVTVIFSLERGSKGEEHLSVVIEVENTSGEPAPVTLGWHPYLRVPGVTGISNLSLVIPARAKVLADSRVIPLPGDSAFAGVSAPVRHDYLGSLKIDGSYTYLVPDDDGVVATELRDPARGTRIVMTQEPSEAPVVHVFTGDGLPRGARQSIAIEPCSALSDAYNRADSAAHLPLAVGETRSLTATLTYIEPAAG